MPARPTRYDRHVLLAERAHALRAAPTLEEALLWDALRGRRLGVAFRRQTVLLGRYIVDFYAPAARLAVEVDGGYHRDRKRADARRDWVLERAGYRVLRLPVELVRLELARAVERVGQALGSR